MPHLSVFLLALLPSSPFSLFSSFPLVEDESPHIAPAGLKLIMIEGGEITPLKVMVSKAS